VFGTAPIAFGTLLGADRPVFDIICANGRSQRRQM
jgi:hypothetical protein